MAIDLARVITVADRAFRAGTEKFGLAGNEVASRFRERRIQAGHQVNSVKYFSPRGELAMGSLKIGLLLANQFWLGREQE
jgi:hypothetical protein